MTKSSIVRADFSQPSLNCSVHSTAPAPGVTRPDDRVNPRQKTLGTMWAKSQQGRNSVIRPKSIMRWVILSLPAVILAFGYVYAQQPAPQPQAPNPYLMGTEGLNQGPRGLTSYMPVAGTETFAQLFARMTAAKAGIEQAHTAVLNERYDLSDRPAQGVTMDRGKPVQEGVRVKLPAGMTWERLAATSPDEIRERNLYPKGF